jgi:putative transcriptional regulator
MTMTMTRKALLWLLSLFGAAALVVAIAAAQETAAPPAPAAGQLLVASRAIGDPRFYHSVVLLLRHDKTGAFGIVINRLVATRPLAVLLAGINGGKQDRTITGDIRIFLGGPVEPQFGFVIHSTDYHRPQTIAIGGGLAMTASREVLRDIGHHKGPAKYLFALGYAGWGAGQLEGEIARHDWFTAPADPALVFDADRATLWQKALARRTRQI